MNKKIVLVRLASLVLMFIGLTLILYEFVLSEIVSFLSVVGLFLFLLGAYALKAIFLKK